MQKVIQPGKAPFALEAHLQRTAARGGKLFDATVALPEGVALLRPVYCVAGGMAVGAALLYGGIEAASLMIAALIALWAFVEPRTTLWLCTAYMIFLFVFFQSTAPLGEEVPEEFFYWGIGIALITAGLMAATMFSSQVEWAIARRRLRLRASIAMLGMLIIILAATVYGFFAGNQIFAVTRQLFGCLLLPVYYFLGVTLFRSAADVELWMRRVIWVVGVGSAWYGAKLLQLSLAHGMYYREASPLSAYSGAIAVVAWSHLVARRRMGVWLRAIALLLACLMLILLIGNRTALGSFLAASVAVTLLAIRKRRALALALATCVLPIAMGVTPYVMTQLSQSRGLPGYIADRFLIVLSEDDSYQGRVAQSEVVMNMVDQRPILGAGMGSENTFIMPGAQRRVKVASVDNGLGYLLLKMGYVGFGVFILMLVLLLKQGLSGLLNVHSPTLRATRLAVIGVFLYAIVSFLSGPTLFHFDASPFFATALGALVVMGEIREPGAAIPSGRLTA